MKKYRTVSFKHKVIGFGFGLGKSNEDKPILTVMIPTFTFQLIKEGK